MFLGRAGVGCKTLQGSAGTHSHSPGNTKGFDPQAQAGRPAGEEVWLAGQRGCQYWGEKKRLKFAKKMWIW